MKQELLTLRKHMSSSRFFGVSVLLIVLGFLCCVFVLFYSRFVSCAYITSCALKLISLLLLHVSIDNSSFITRVYR